MRDVVIASACRTPTGSFLGGLSPLPATRLGGLVCREALTRAGVAPDRVNEVILGQVLQAGAGQNPARQAALRAEVPSSVGALTINKVCGSGLKAVILAAQAIRAGDADVILAGGMESMSNAPYLVRRAREGYRLGHGELTDSMVADGLWDVYGDYHMGETAERAAEKYGLSREEQDAYALESHRRAVAARDAGLFDAEIVPVEVERRRGAPVRIEADETPRADTSMEALGRLKPVFREDGTVTPGNAPGCNDGASALLVMAADVAADLPVDPLARITGYATGGMDPEWVMLAPIDAVERLLERTGGGVEDFDRIELNEAFAAAALAVTEELGMDREKVNVRGGAVALGHPIGASGARILTTLLHTLRDDGLESGLAAMCLGGGNAVALAVEAVR